MSLAQRSPESLDRERLSKVVLAVGFLAFAAGVLAAHRSPATGYELSIYGSTPVAFWVGMGAALAIAVGVVVTADGFLRGVGLALGGLAVTAFAGLPLLRGYHFFGEADSLTHLGWARDMATGTMSPVELFYPGFHSTAALVGALTGYELTRATMVTVLVFVVCFFVFVPLAAWRLTGRTDVAAVAAVSGFMLLPINVFVTVLVPHPISQTALFLPLALYLTVCYLVPTDSRWYAAGFGVLLALVSVSFVFFHPQQALVLLLLLGGITAAQMVTRRYRPSSPVASLHPATIPTIVLGVAFVIWMILQPSLVRQSGIVVDGIASMFVGGSEVGEVVEDRGDSLAAIGGSLAEIFAKLFLVSLVYVLLTAGLVLAALRGSLEDDRLRAVVASLVPGMIAIGVLTALHLAGPLSKLVFRYVASGMALATILGSIALVRLVLPRGVAAASHWRHGTVVVALAVMLVVSLPAVFASPYVYQASMHVTEQQLDGYDRAFDVADPDVEFVGVRWNAWRYGHAVAGTAADTPRGEYVRPHEFSAGIPDAYDGPNYVVVTRFDREREVNAYRGIRYPAEEFDRAETNPRFDRVSTNGEFTLYYTD